MVKTVIIKEFKEKVVEVFGKNLDFAFICGSFARGTANSESDIDMFVCVKKINKGEEYIFRKWYRTIHLQRGFNPDTTFSGEIMSHRDLLEKISKTEKCKPTAIIRDRDIYDGLVWAGMLSGESTALVGNRGYLKRLNGRSYELCKYWSKSLLPFSRSKKFHLLLKKLIKYKLK